ncbi:hypothetical protein [Halomonas denitrificans]|nr:hypothetical protein [Halomonas denitrificans]
MNAWLALVVRIALLRAGPQDLPASSAALWLAMALWWGLTGAMLLFAPDPPPVRDVLLTFALQLASIQVVLALARRPARFGQVAQALFATGALVGLLNLPLWLAAGPADGAAAIPGPLVVLALIGLFWSLAVDGHVWRHALELPYAGGIAVAVLVFLLQIIALEAVGIGP